MDRLNLILDEKSEILELNDAIDLNEIHGGEIQFRNVSFKYPNSNYNALTDINFTVEKGKTLAIVGKTGSGKTTIVNLLLRLYDISQGGEILIDDMDVKKIYP